MTPGTLEPVLFGLDHLFWVHCELFVADVLNLLPHDQIAGIQAEMACQC